MRGFWNQDVLFQGVGIDKLRKGISAMLASFFEISLRTHVGGYVIG